MVARFLLLVSLLVNTVVAQTPGQSREVHPKLITYKCTKNGCKAQNTAIVLDSGSHPNHQKNNASLTCGSSGSAPDVTVCPDEATCARNCIVEGISDYSQYGIATSGDSMNLRMLLNGRSVSPRVYLLSDNQNKYEMFELTGNELAFDVDVSKLPCGMNGALYLTEMDEKGGKNKYNAAGAYYGTGYCDAQCFVGPFINGVGNIEGKGACCNEMDIWEANARSTQTAPHTCNVTGLYGCTGDQCGSNGVCDESGCGWNEYALGHHDYYGLGERIDTSKPFTVVTQFPAQNGKLTAINRLYVQNGKVIQSDKVNVTGLPAVSEITDAYCTAAGATAFESQGGLAGMGSALSRGMVLAFSIWWDSSGNMTWLDSGKAGPCNATEGNPTVIQEIQPDTAVTFSAIKWGELGSTYATGY